MKFESSLGKSVMLEGKIVKFAASKDGKSYYETADKSDIETLKKCKGVKEVKGK